MKKLILLLFIPLISLSSFGQGEVTQLMRIAKMDLEKFEVFALENNYKFKKFDDKESYRGLSMVRGTGDQTEYLTVYDKFFEFKYSSSYQAGKQKRLPNIYQELEKLGFKLVDMSNYSSSKSEVNSYRKQYKRGNKEFMTIHIMDDGVTIEMSYMVNY